MKVVTALEGYAKQKNDIFCFLAGGITGCPNWQNEILKILAERDPENLVIFNPRVENFDVTDPYASQAQIEWEYRYLNQMDIFSMYFCKDTIQPICMYELGRYIEVMKRRFPLTFEDRIIISVEPDYARREDVISQVNLAFEGRIPKLWVYKTSYEQHSCDILECYKEIKDFNGDSYIRKALKKLKIESVK